ncbi:polysaccharide lyase family 1 protein [Pelomonas sp. Root1444]|uniref:pectate lyase family protein n=1 Tax=Pelomonas sp. Root1444 TaxID=1736464 RepID=UPI000702F817|nr:pectate lyase [Pelomonas sp. Root1444]KQY88525.1 pectate lyase [Pelomonas sp. Root1444]
MRALWILALAAGLCHAAESTAPLHPATYVHAGWAQTTGGQGGKIIRVTTLAAEGPGSLKAALDTPGPRIVVFEVGGVIDMAGKSWKLREGKLTLAGQTAPDPGITLVKGELEVFAKDVVIQHISIRPGAYGRPKRSGNDHDGLSTSDGAANVIVDHCTFSWATDENLSAGGHRFEGATPDDWRAHTSHALTFSHNLIYEGLGESVHVKGEHSKGSLIHDNATQTLLLGNVYASNRERNALFKGGVWAAMVNNLIYNPGARAVHYNLIAHEWVGKPYQTGKITLAGNVYRAGPGTVLGLPLFTLGGVGDVQLFEQDNLAVDRNGLPLPVTGRYTTGPAQIVPVREAYLPRGLSWLPPRELERLLPLYVGSRPWARDPLDFKQLSDIAEDRGQLIDDETQNNPDGLPRRKPTQRAFVEADWNLADMSPKAGWASLFTQVAR